MSTPILPEQRPLLNANRILGDSEPSDNDGLVSESSEKPREWCPDPKCRCHTATDAITGALSGGDDWSASSSARVLTIAATLLGVVGCELYVLSNAGRMYTHGSAASEMGTGRVHARHLPIMVESAGVRSVEMDTAGSIGDACLAAHLAPVEKLEVFLKDTIDTNVGDLPAVTRYDPEGEQTEAGDSEGDAAGGGAAN